MVEPLPELFARLQANYAGVDRVTCVQAAVSATDGARPLFHLQPDPDLPYWQDMIASFERDVLVAHGREIQDIEERIVTTEVPTLTFTTLCSQPRPRSRRPAGLRHRGSRLGDPARRSTSNATGRA